MADVWLKDPKSGYQVAVGSTIEAANLRAAGYTDVDEPEPSSGENTSDSGSSGEPPSTGETPSTGGKSGGETPPTGGAATEQTTESSKPANRRR